jgi:hypothetical protein
MGARPRIGLFAAALVLTNLAAPAAAGGSSPPPVTVRVILAQARTVAGRPLKGTVVLTNTTRTPITVATCAADGWLAVGLSGRVDSYPFAHYEIACAPTVHLAPGPNRLRVTVLTTYDTCTQPEPAGGAAPTPAAPTCTVNGLPPLPAGRYTTKVDLVGLDGLTQTPNDVTIDLSRPAHPPPLAPCADRPGTAPPTVVVPDVVGDNSFEAASLLARACLNAGYASPVGHVVTAASPAAGAHVPEHSTVELTTR